MHLELGTFPVKEVAFDTRARLAGGILRVNPDEISSIVLEDERIKKVKIEVVRPGDDARILYLRDVVEPRIKVEGPGNVFPGILGGVDVVGSGKTHRLAGVAVMESVRTPEALFDTPELTEDQQLRTNANDSFLDMAGPGALRRVFLSSVRLLPRAPMDPLLSPSIENFIEEAFLSSLSEQSSHREAVLENKDSGT